MSSEETSIYATKEDLEELKSDLKQIIDTVVCGKINLHTIAAQKYITPQAA